MASWLNWPFGGMCSSSVRVTKSISRPSLGLPGTTVSPRSPPFNSNSREARFKPDFVLAPPWQSKQFLTSTSRTLSLNNAWLAAILVAWSGGTGCAIAVEQAKMSRTFQSSGRFIGAREMSGVGGP